MRKEIEALKNLIAAADAEEKARHTLERERQHFFSRHIITTNGPIELPPEFNAASEAWAKAFSDLAGARGIAKYLIREAEEAARATSLRPAKKCFDCDGEPGSCHMNCGQRDEDNGPAARLPT